MRNQLPRGWWAACQQSPQCLLSVCSAMCGAVSSVEGVRTCTNMSSTPQAIYAVRTVHVAASAADKVMRE